MATIGFQTNNYLLTVSDADPLGHWWGETGFLTWVKSGKRYNDIDFIFDNKLQ